MDGSGSVLAASELDEEVPAEQRYKACCCAGAALANTLCRSGSSTRSGGAGIRQQQPKHWRRTALAMRSQWRQAAEWTVGSSSVRTPEREKVRRVELVTLLSTRGRKSSALLEYSYNSMQREHMCGALPTPQYNVLEESPTSLPPPHPPWQPAVLGSQQAAAQGSRAHMHGEGCGAGWRGVIHALEDVSHDVGVAPKARKVVVHPVGHQLLQQVLRHQPCSTDRDEGL